MRGLFWNYLSLGLDAEAAYGFHRMREAHSWAASTRLLNQAWYSYFSCTSGWFCGAQVGGRAVGWVGGRESGWVGGRLGAAPAWVSGGWRVSGRKVLCWTLSHF